MKQFTSDGCSHWWNGFYNLFCDACRDHDRIYGLGDNSCQTRLQTDIELGQHVIASSFSPKLACWQRSIVLASVPVMFAGGRCKRPKKVKTQQVKKQKPLIYRKPVMTTKTRTKKKTLNGALGLDADQIYAVMYGVLKKQQQQINDLLNLTKDLRGKKI
jgi:hypothetical protein